MAKVSPRLNPTEKLFKNQWWLKTLYQSCTLLKISLLAGKQRMIGLRRLKIPTAPLEGPTKWFSGLFLLLSCIESRIQMIGSGGTSPPHLWMYWGLYTHLFLLILSNPLTSVCHSGMLEALRCQPTPGWATLHTGQSINHRSSFFSWVLRSWRKKEEMQRFVGYMVYILRLGGLWDVMIDNGGCCHKMSDCSYWLFHEEQ